MNAERLHATLIALSEEMTKKDTSSKMGALIAALESVVDDPAAPNQQELANSLKAMYSSVTNTPSDAFSPTSRQILSEIGAEGLFGQTLKETIENIFAQNQITPAVALQELQELYKKLESLEEALKNGTSALRHFKIGNEQLSPGECEIGLLIPRKAVSNRLVDLADELKEIGFILNTFAEVATGKKDELAIRTISSSDLLVYLDAVAPYAACLAVAIERIVALYRQLLEIRKLRQDIRKQGVPEEQTLGIENYANELMSKGIEKISVEILELFYRKKDQGRKNELTNAVRISLSRLANRIDQGFNVEVRAEPIEQKEGETKQDSQVRDAIALIQKASGNMQFLKLDGQPILKLPDGKRERSKKKPKADTPPNG